MRRPGAISLDTLRRDSNLPSLVFRKKYALIRVVRTLFVLTLVAWKANTVPIFD